MRVRLSGLLGAALVAGLAGCSLPEVLPLAGGPTSGPSPYGPWYEQHWATNAVLLAATDEPGDGDFAGDVEAFQEHPDFTETDADTGVKTEPLPEAAVETNAALPVHSADADTDFDNSSPYQFPAGDYAPAPAALPAPANQPAPPPEQQVLPPDANGIRY